MRSLSLQSRTLAIAALAGLSSYCISSLQASAQVGRFDLLGPRIDVHVSRGDQSLPIASVPNLQPGDRLQVHADLPSTQSVHLLMVVVFLRGTTNPPPESWFTRIETWNKHVRDEGVTVTVPDEAQQALIFVAPETGGDFSTLKSAVRGRPGIFVRAAQDLNEASFEQSRIERYAQALLQVPPGSPEQLLDHSRKLAATLNLKPNDDCFKRPPDLQLACLRQSGTQLLLDDGHGQNLAQTLSTGPTSDLIGAVAGTPVATAGGAGAYSAYVGTVLDVVRLLTNLHTAHFQYIPAIAFPEADALNLRLNTAPSFHDPKSVIVIALPSIVKAEPPPLQMQNPNHISCLLQSRMVLPLNGAPLVFATGFAHDLVLHLDHPGPDGRTDLPLLPDAFNGGLAVDTGNERKPLGASAPAARAGVPGTTKILAAANTPPPSGATSKKSAPSPAAAGPGTHPAAPLEIHGTVQGFWGFDAFQGPTVPLQARPGADWSAAPRNELFVGHSNTLLLHADATACTESIAIATAPQDRLDWRQEDGDGLHRVAVKLPLEKSAPGSLTLLVRQYGEAAPDKVNVTAYSDMIKPQELRIHAGDSFATLLGTGLGDVKSLDLNGTTFLPSAEQGPDGKLLRLGTVSQVANSGTGKDSNSRLQPFKAGEHGTAQIALKDGRTLPVPFAVDAARPAFTLLSRSTQPITDGVAASVPLTLTDKEAIPLNSRLSFAIRSVSPAKFARSEKAEIATTDGSLHTTLSLADRSLVLQDSHTALGFLAPATVFGPSAFGELQLRVLTEDGNTSDWVPLGTLVRTPTIRQVTCGGHPAALRASAAVAAVTASSPAADAPNTSGTGAEPKHVDTPCTLTGTDLFLIESVSPDTAFTAASVVPPGYAADSLAVPRPADNHTLYLRLRDDPQHVASLNFDASEQHAAKRITP